mgnify:CR=1 FL=1|jgi:archaellum component FlaC
MNKRQAKKKELDNKILDIRNDYREQDKKLDALNMVNDKIFNEFKKMMVQFEKQEKSLQANKESLSNVLEAQTFLEIQNSDRMIEFRSLIRKQNERIHILEYGLVGMIIIFIAMLLFEVILWYL